MAGPALPSNRSVFKDLSMNHRSNQTPAGLSRRAIIKGAAAAGAYPLLLASDDGAYYLGATLNPNGGDVMV